MSEDLQMSEYNFKGFSVRSGLDQNGNIWFVAKDVCDVLGLSNSRDAVSALPEKTKAAVRVADTEGQQRLTTVVSESGLYRLVMKSNKPEAEVFQDWVCEDVLPEIRKKGYYIDKAAVETDFTKLDALTDEVASLRMIESSFYRKITDAFKRASDYDTHSSEMNLFFATIQNRFLYAITQKTASEIVVSRISADKERCGMTVEKPVTQPNLKVSKNYLEDIELRKLVMLGVAYLEVLAMLETTNTRITTTELVHRFDKLVELFGLPVSIKGYSLSAKVRDARVKEEYMAYKKSHKK